ncbi:MAG: cupin domain-containing protein [Candidatus Omnitrophica bacterium]|nr:cupin domain-containing protein [Candidatus Omnitrophota bacterium]
MKTVGKKIKRIREDYGFTLRQLAADMGVSASLLSQIETGKASPSLSTLKGIADCLGVTIARLIDEPQKQKDVFVMKEKQRKSSKKEAEGMTIHMLTSPDINKQMEPLLFKLEKKASSGEKPYQHFGQEFVLVLKGALELVLDETEYVLRKGDSIYFNSSIPHSFKNLHEGVTEALWVDTPPTF